MNSIVKLLLAFFILFLSNQVQSQETIIHYLSGTGEDNTVDWDFYCTEGNNSGVWTSIAVPSCWELQGFGKYNYGHDKDSERGKEKGLYKYNFQVPSDWKGKIINIVFEGSMTDTEVKINGQSAGKIHQGAFYQFKYDISKLLKYGKENLLEVSVAKHSANESVNEAERRADFWIFGGIFRPVFLEVKPSEHIVRTALNAKANGDFSIDIYTKNIKHATQLSAQIKTISGENIGFAFTSNIGKNSVFTQLLTTAKNIKTWTPEFPYLYKVEVSLLSPDGIIHSVSEKFGFRTVELKPRDGFYVNGVKIKFKGVCRHSFWPESGRTMSKRLSIEDVNLLKEMNMNAVRMSHYPPDSHFLDVCDSLGLFVLDELAGWQTNYDTKTGSELAHKMIFHDVNHPSIVIWDNGNEGGWNYDVDHWFEELDPQKRPLIHPWQVFKNTDTQHYKDWDYGNATHQHGHNVTFPTEFLHGLYDGGHGAGLEDFWRQMWQNPLSAGGFLWVYADEAVVRTDKNRELDADKNHAPDGIVGPYHEKEGSFFTIKEIWSPIFFEKRFITSHFDGTFNIENRYHYTNINQCHFKWNLVKLPLPGETKQTSVASGKTHSPNIQPNHKGELKIDLPTDFTSADVLYVTATDPHGKEIYTWSWPISLPEKVSGIIVDKTIGEITNFSETDETVTLTAIGTEIEISKKTCQLLNIIANNKSVSLSNGPVFIETIAKSDGVKTYREGNNVVVEAITKNKLKQLKWTLYPSGWLRLDVQYFPPYNTTLMGITFSYPEEKIKGMTWMGDGPYRVYKNRLKGTTFNVWDKKYNNTITGESTYGLEYPEFKGFHKNLYWATIDTEEQPFTVVCATENIYLHMLTPDKPQKGETNYAFAEYPKGNISFLHGISPIGTKFRSAEKTGPMGQKNAYTTHGTEYPKDLTLYFNFGEN